LPTEGLSKRLSQPKKRPSQLSAHSPGVGSAPRAHGPGPSFIPVCCLLFVVFAPPVRGGSRSGTSPAAFRVVGLMWKGAYYTQGPGETPMGSRPRGGHPGGAGLSTSTGPGARQLHARLATRPDLRGPGGLRCASPATPRRRQPPEALLLKMKISTLPIIQSPWSGLSVSLLIVGWLRCLLLALSLSFVLLKISPHIN
jgi:hypothetical protein